MNPNELIAVQRGALIMYRLMRGDGLYISEIAGLIGVKNRQAYYIMSHLSECDIPIYSNRGRWQVLKHWEDTKK